MRKTAVMGVICIVGALLNIAIHKLCTFTGIQLYLDTVFTVAVTLSCGLLWGAVCGALTNLICYSVWFWGWEAYLFALCNIATAFITWGFVWLFPRDLGIVRKTPNTADEVSFKSTKLSRVMDKVIALMLLAFALCLAMSVMGGVISAAIWGASPSFPYESSLLIWLGKTMFAENIPTVVREIVARIPVNMVDRLITAFAGYGIATLYSLLPTPRSPN
ncbi:MAG: hypothetical protein LBI14_06170 [Treponema sp.]|jgi:hypothetical protein|nr:hypothetical protein [Treponema sp.]